ncbi:MAG TPA: DUF1232 domain-containing protein [Verrucomicrobiae bacterium]|nr:DUF1232 domain-containing protein [Verrucomicrobiae bacterium]
MSSEIAQFVEHGASRVTPQVIGRLLHKLPMLKAEFTQIDEPSLPHLIDQLEFLADVVEDVADGSYQNLPYHAFAVAAFALIYAHKAVDIIPDEVPGIGHADDSAVVRYALLRYRTQFEAYAISRELDWSTITTAP